MNTGHEKRIGPYPVDGYCSETKTVFQFHGCYFHGHECVLTKSIRNKKLLETKHQKFQRTKETTDYIKQLGYQVIEIWECNYKELKKECSNLRTIIDDSLPSFLKNIKGLSQKIKFFKTSMTDPCLEWWKLTSLRQRNVRMIGNGICLHTSILKKWRRYFAL